MSELGIIFAIILLSWVYAAPHEANLEVRDSGAVQIITVLLTVAALVFGIGGAIFE